MSKKKLFGIVVVIIGLNIFMNSFMLSTGSLIAPLIFFVLGYYFYQKDRKLLSTLFFVISAVILFDQLFGLNFFALLIAGICLYYGMRLIRGHKPKSKRNKDWRRERTEGEEIQESPAFSQEREKVKERVQPQVDGDYGDSYYSPIIRRNLIGDIHYTRDQFELHDMTISNGFGDIKIDLSKAIIPEGETVIILQGLIGQINVYVPDDLATSIQANSLIGDVTLFYQKHKGINQQLHITTPGYKNKPRRVKLVLSVAIGEVKVRAV